MLAAWLIAGIAFAATVFMLGFLVALLREDEPSVCYWVVPVRREPEKEEHLTVLRGIYFADDCRATENNRAGCGFQLLENDHAKEKRSSGFIALDVGHVSDGLGRRSIDPRCGDLFRERQL